MYLKRKILLLLLIFQVTLLFSQQNTLPNGVTLFKSGKDYIIKYQLPDYKMADINYQKENKQFTKLSIEGYGIIASKGMPELPQISFNLVISYDEEIKPQMIISVKKRKSIEIINPIFPSQMMNEINMDKFSINSNYYNSSIDVDTVAVVSISEPFIISGVKGVTVTIMPFIYNPGKRTVTIVQEAEIKIQLTKEPETRVVRTKSLDQHLSNLFINYSTNNNSQFEIKMNKSSSANSMLKSSSSVSIPDKGNYLMLVPWDYDDVAFKFFLHKNAMGYNVIYYRYLGYDDYLGTTLTSPEEIKAVIQSCYNNPETRPEYVLLIGGNDDIGTWQYSTDGETVNSDLGYAQLDGIDILADVVFGRWPVEHWNWEDQLNSIISKTIKMDNNFHIITSAEKKAVIVADDDPDFWADLICPDFAESSDDISTWLSGYNYDCTKLYEKDGKTTSDISNAINQGAYIVSYRGHGTTPTCRWAGPAFDYSNASALTNQIYPVVFSLSCHTGNFVYQNSLGNGFMLGISGACAFVGATNSVDHIGDMWFATEIFRDGLPVETELGRLVNKAKVDFANTIYIPTVSGSRKQCLIIAFNILGDPALTLRHDDCSGDYVITSGDANIGETLTFPIADNIIVAGVGQEYSDDYKLSYTVKGNGTSGANVTINAGSSIVLNSGFKVEKGATFHAATGSICSSQKSATQIESDYLELIPESVKIPNQKGSSNKVKCYPNPVSDQVIISINTENQAKVNIKLYDIKGNLIKRMLSNQVYPAGSFDNYYDLTDLKAGIYFYKIDINNEMFYGKLIKK